MDASKTQVIGRRPTDIVGYVICAWIAAGYLCMWLTQVVLALRAPQPLVIFSSISLLFFPTNLVAFAPGLSRGWVLALALLAPVDLLFMMALIRYRPLADLGPVWKAGLYLLFSAVTSLIVMYVFLNHMFLRPGYP